MKRVELIRELRRQAGAVDVALELVRQGAAHEVWQVGIVRVVIPRHREINERTAQGIIRTVIEGTRR